MGRSDNIDGECSTGKRRGKLRLSEKCASIYRFCNSLDGRRARSNNEGKCYDDFVNFQLSLVWNLSYYTSPLIITFLYRRGYFVAESITSFAKVSTGIGLIVMISLCVRGFGRSQSKSYTKFVKALEEAKMSKSGAEAKQKLRMFDFSFRDWPVDFNVRDVVGYAYGETKCHFWAL